MDNFYKVKNLFNYFTRQIGLKDVLRTRFDINAVGRSAVS